MTTTKLTIETAPRDPVELAKQGRFNLRCLAVELSKLGGFFESEEDKQGFMSLNVEDQAAALVNRMQEIDGKKNSKGKGATAAATNGAAARTPSNKGTKGKPETTPTTTSAAGQSSGGGANAERLITAIEELKDTVAGLSEKLDNLGTVVNTQQGVISGTNRFVMLTNTLMLMFAEQVLNSSGDQVLEMAIGDLPSIETKIAGLLGIELPEEEQETDEGNE